MNEQHNPKYPVDAKRTVKATPMVEDFWEGVHEPGASCKLFADGNSFAFACPGCCRAGTIRVGNPKPSNSPSWEIVSGVVDDPTTLTLNPSINCVGCCGWHGYLRNGVYQSC